MKFLPSIFSKAAVIGIPFSLKNVSSSLLTTRKVTSFPDALILLTSCKRILEVLNWQVEEIYLIQSESYMVLSQFKISTVDELACLYSQMPIVIS